MYSYYITEYTNPNHFLFWCLYFSIRIRNLLIITFPVYIMQFIFKLQCSWKLSRKFCFHLKNAIQNRGHSIYLCLWKGKLFPVKMILCVTFSLGLSFDIRVFSMLNKLSVNGWRLFILCIYMLSKHMTYFSGWIYILGILVIKIWNFSSIFTCF